MARRETYTKGGRIVSYGIGKISAVEGMTLVAMLIVPSIYLTEPSLSIGFVGNSAWLLKICSGLLLLGLLLAILKIYQNYIDKFCNGRMITFFSFVQGVLGRSGGMIFFILWAVLFHLSTVLMIREFTDHTLMTTLKTGNLKLVLLIFAVAIFFMMRYGLEVILRCAYLLLVVRAITLIILLFLLFSSYDVTQLLPWQGYGMGSLAKYSFLDIGTGATSMAIFFIIPHLQNIATMKKSILYGMAYVTFFKMILILMMIMTFGIIVSPERVLLFYELVRCVNLSQYVQRVDSIFILMWLTAGLMSIVVTQYLSVMIYCEAFKLTDSKALMAIAMLLTTSIAMLPDSTITALTMSGFFIYQWSTAFMVFSFIILGIGYYVKCRRNSSCVGQGLR